MPGRSGPPIGGVGVILRRRPAPCAPRPAPCALRPAPCALRPAPRALRPAPCAPRPALFAPRAALPERRQAKREATTASELAVARQRACHAVEEVLHDHETEPGCRVLTRGRVTNCRLQSLQPLLIHQAQPRSLILDAAGDKRRL